MIIYFKRQCADVIIFTLYIQQNGKRMGLAKSPGEERIPKRDLHSRQLHLHSQSPAPTVLDALLSCDSHHACEQCLRIPAGVCHTLPPK